MTMRISKAMTMVLAAAMLLAGCGKGPATGVDTEATTKRLAAVKGQAATAKAMPATPKAAAKPGVATTSGKKTTAVASAKPAAAAGEGSIKLTIRLWGTAPVTSLGLMVVSQDDPTLKAEVELPLTGPEAVWEGSDLPAGRYTLRVAALNGEGLTMGGGSTEAIVTGGELADVTLDVTVDTATPVPVATPTPNTGVLSEPTPTPVPTATATPATGMGGTLGLHVEVF